MITLTIKDEIYENENPTNVYVVECEAMFGDGDGKKYVELGPFKSKVKEIDYLEEVIRLCKRMKETDDRDEYCDLEGFDVWLGGEILEGMDEDDPRFDFADDWPNDPSTDYSTPASFQGYKIYYYDKNGKKFNVEATLN